MKKLDMTGFVYETGNSIEFEGTFGKVKLTYIRFQNEYDFFEGKEVELPSHFIAELYCNGEGNLPNIGKGITEENALENVYTEYAKFRAMEDMGRI